MANPEAFTTEKFFGVNGGKTHLLHALRDKFDRERIPEPNILLQKYENEELVETTKEELYQAYQYNLKNKQRKNSNLYFEEMVSDYDLNKTQEIAAYLSEQFEGRPVYVIQHFDESHPHTHFIVFYKDLEHNKAPRIPQKKLWEIRNDIPKITGQHRTMAGAGKQKHVGLQKDPETQEKLLEQERKKAEELQGILNQIEAILKLYGSIKIFALNRNKGIRFTVRNALKQEVFTSIDQIPIKKLVQIAEKEGEELYFQPTQEETIKAVFLDDLPPTKENLLSLPKNSLVVQTSASKIQVHIPLPEPLPIDKADQLQKAMVNFYNADPGSKDLYHFRRLPGFPNKKYVEKPQVKVLGYVGAKDWNTLIDEVNKNQERIEKEQEERWKQIQQKEPTKAPDIALEQEYGSKIWHDRLLKAEGDESRADLSYAMYLLRKGFSEEAVKYLLAEVSENLEFRKAGHVQDYLNRTVEKAKQFLQFEDTKTITRKPLENNR